MAVAVSSGRLEEVNPAEYFKSFYTDIRAGVIG